MKVSIVILNWNREKDTIDCLESINELRIANYEVGIIVVDNASSDKSIYKISKYLKILKEETGLNSEVIINNSNLGFAGGNNVGIKHAINHGSDYVLILNNDTMVDASFLSHLLETAQKNKNVGAVSPKIYFAKGFEFHKKRYKNTNLGKVIWYAGGILDWNNVYGKTRGVDEVDRGQFNETIETDFATGTCMLLSKRTIEKVGMFDDKFYMYYEDTDLCMRLKSNKLKIYFAPKSIIWHKVAQSSSIGGDLNDYFITRNRLLFGMRYASLRLYPINICNLLFS